MQYLDDRELELLLRTVAERRYGRGLGSAHRNARRDHALFVLLANVGMRPGEALAVNQDDLHLVGAEPWVRIRRLKSRRAAGSIDDVPISRAVARVLSGYLARISADEARSRLFPITVRQLERLFHLYANRCGLRPGLRLYCLRHTALTRAYRLTRDLRLVQQMAGHASVTTTQIYTHVDPVRRRELAELAGSVT